MYARALFAFFGFAIFAYWSTFIMNPAVLRSIHALFEASGYPLVKPEKGGTSSKPATLGYVTSNNQALSRNLLSAGQGNFLDPLETLRASNIEVTYDKGTVRFGRTLNN